MAAHNAAVVDGEHSVYDPVAAWNELVPTVLSLVVETCTADHLDTKAMCSLLQVSTACRKALRGSRGQQRVSINPAGAAAAGFKAWLAQWAGLVAEVHLQQPPVPTGEAYKTIRQRMQLEAAGILAAMGQCTATAGPNPASTTAAAPTGMPLLLIGFSADVDEFKFMQPAVWAGLPLAAPALTHLGMSNIEIPWSADVSAALQQLPDLRRLKLTSLGDCKQ